VRDKQQRTFPIEKKIGEGKMESSSVKLGFGEKKLKGKERPHTRKQGGL
jgi:hypothetical protein